MGVALYEFLGAAAWEGNGEAAIVFVAFDANDSSHAEFGMADFAAEKWIGIAAASGGAIESWRSGAAKWLASSWS